MTHIIKIQDTQVPIFDKNGNLKATVMKRLTFCGKDTAKEKRFISRRFYEVEKAAGRDKNPNLPICQECINALKNG